MDTTPNTAVMNSGMVHFHYFVHLLGWFSIGLLLGPIALYFAVVAATTS